MSFNCVHYLVVNRRHSFGILAKRSVPGWTHVIVRYYLEQLNRAHIPPLLHRNYLGGMKTFYHGIWLSRYREGRLEQYVKPLLDKPLTFLGWVVNDDNPIDLACLQWN